MMNIVSRKMIKPCKATPQNLKHYNISSTDQVIPSLNVPIILFYPSSPSYDVLMSINRLQQSLANILPRFYPLAGRYVRKDHLVHCSDEGVEFVEACACPDNFKDILEYVERAMLDQKLNDMLLPRLTCEADEVTDPIVSVQVTRFLCGGLAIGLIISHKIVDADSISTFISAWAEEAKILSLKESESNRVVVNPSFVSPTLLPFKKSVSGLEGIQLPRTMNPNIISKRFLFNKEIISSLKSKINDRSRRVSKVNVVCALISKALIHVDRLKHGRIRNFLISQAVNIRDRTIPPFPKHSCGNLIAMSMVKLCPLNPTDGDRKLNVGFEDLVSLLRDAIDKTITDCASLFNDSGDEGRNILYDSFMDLTRTAMTSSEETRVIAFSDWSKLEFYNADFGWGTPIWTSTTTVRGNNLVVLMGSKEGDGIEAWVQLFREDMVLFEQHEDIIRLLDTSKT